MKPYPLLLKPPIKDYLWGGTRLITDFGFETTSAKAAEAWVLLPSTTPSAHCFRNF